MEKEIKKTKSKNIIIGIIIGLIISAIGIFVYYIIIGNDGIVREEIKINHGNSNNQINDVITLDEDDVKKWLNDNSGIMRLFVEEKNNFDINTTDKEKISGILSWFLMFGGANVNAIETQQLDYNSGYTYQYTYTTQYIKDILTKYFNLGIDMIDTNMMNNNFNELANFSIDNNEFIVKVVATGLDNYYTSKLNKISLDKDNNIVVNYSIEDCMVTGSPDNCKSLGNREIVLKKTNDGYNILKAYDVKN